MDEGGAPGSVRGGVVAVGLIAVVLAGLGYVRSGLGVDSVVVPAGAAAGQLVLRPCAYPSEGRDYAADCGTLVVPENRAVAGSRLIALPVTRVRALTAHPGEPLFYLEGGPGLTNVDFTEAGRFAADRDVVMVGYRGVDGSVRLDCPEVESALTHSADMLTEASFRAYGDALHACAQRFTDAGVDLAGYGLPQEADDIEAARVAFGYPRIDLLSQSAGTRTAMIYAWRHPRGVRRSVMLGANPPGHFLFDTRTTDEQIRRYAALCAQDAGCRARTDDLAATMHSVAVDMPDRWWLLPIAGGAARVAAAFASAESTQAAGQLSAPAAFDAWLAAAHGDGSGLWLQAELGKVVLAHSLVWGQYAAAGMLDAPAARAYFTGAQDTSSLGWAESALAWGGGRMTDSWPTSPDENTFSRVRPSDVETLLISGALDTATPPQAATTELLPALRRGHQVVLPGFGHVGSFFAEQQAAGTHLINVYLADGIVDTSRYHPQTVDFTPATAATAAAKTSLAIAVAVAALAALWLVLAARRVRVRSRLGRTSAAVLRSCGAVVIGAGGWLLGLLVVLAVWPSVPFDDETLAVACIAVAVGIAVFVGWWNRVRSGSRTAVGLALTVTGALAGAWLGFHATGAVFALATALLGATACANLGPLVLDIAAEHTPQQSNAAPSEPADRTPARSG